MHELVKPNSDSRFVELTSNESTLSNNLSLKMGHRRITTQLGFQFQDQDSSSTQSTCQSFPEVASDYGDNKFSIQSGYNGTHEEGSNGSAMSMGVQDIAFASQADYRQPYAACIPLAYPDPYYRGLIPPYGSQAMIHHHPQTMSVTANRVPLPVDFAQDEQPIYVNSKQYNAILRRRQHRAKLEAQNKLAKSRKPYLHESRHVHALKRARGPGGRFLNKKEQESNPATMINGGHVTSHDVHRQEGGKNGNNFHPQDRSFSIYHPQMGGGGGGGDGSTQIDGTHHHHGSVFR